MKCACKSGRTYADCCKPFHVGVSAPNALALMRSRYSAYALSLHAYIMRTTHPLGPNVQTDSNLWRREIELFCKNTDFRDLKILDMREDGDIAHVTFLATLFQGSQDVSFIEESLFEKVEGKWLYKSGQHKIST